jgi:hypothetical protein
MKKIWAERKIIENSTEESKTELSFSNNSSESVLSDKYKALATQNLNNKLIEGDELVQSNDKKNKIKGKKVVVTNIETNISIEYTSISEAALALNITRTTLRTYIKNQTIFNYFFFKGTDLVKEKLLIIIKQ